jgi:hypothetical protein
LKEVILIAKLTHKDYGTEKDVANMKNIAEGTVFGVTDIHMGGSKTIVYFDGFPNACNSIQFDFFDLDGNPVDIYQDTRFNPYIQYKMA